MVAVVTHDNRGRKLTTHDHMVRAVRALQRCVRAHARANEARACAERAVAQMRLDTQDAQKPSTCTGDTTDLVAFVGAMDAAADRAAMDAGAMSDCILDQLAGAQDAVHQLAAWYASWERDGDPGAEEAAAAEDYAKEAEENAKEAEESRDLVVAIADSVSGVVSIVA